MNKRDFLTTQIPTLLAKLTSDTKGNFGLMTPQHMVEHIVFVAKATAVKHEGERESPPNKRQLGFQHFVKNGCVLQYKPSEKTAADLPALKYATIDEAIAEFPVAIQRFYDLWKANPDYTPYASFMGEMSFEDMEHFHFMHFRYHLWQFGLIEQYP